MDTDVTPFQKGLAMGRADIRDYGLWFAVSNANFLPKWNMQHCGYRVAVDTFVGVALDELEAATDWSE